jgi:hypothetical protein
MTRPSRRHVAALSTALFGRLDGRAGRVLAAGRLADRPPPYRDEAAAG